MPAEEPTRSVTVIGVERQSRGELVASIIAERERSSLVLQGRNETVGFEHKNIDGSGKSNFGGVGGGCCGEQTRLW